MSETNQAHPKGFLNNFRKDNWWVDPLIFGLVFGAFALYAPYAAITGYGDPADGFGTTNPVFHYSGDGVTERNYLSPFFSPCLATFCNDGGHAEPWSLLSIGGATFSPAWFVMWMPLGLRATCYYYRKMYYRSYFFSPVACAVDEPRSKYRGESAFPFVLQNLHRYFLYLALLFPPFLFWDVWQAMHVDGGIGLAVGTVVLLLNAILLTGFTFGCHALRHMVGGRLNCFSCSSASRGQYGMWKAVTWFNKKHGTWAWYSLIWVGVTDLFVRGLQHDWWILRSLDQTLIVFGGA